jgi:hypothetical protein
MKKPIPSRIRSHIKLITLAVSAVIIVCVISGVVFVTVVNKTSPSATPRPSTNPGQVTVSDVTTDLTVTGDVQVHIVQATGTCGFPWSNGEGTSVTGGEASNPSAIPSGATIGIAYRLSGIAQGQPWRLDAVSIDGGKRYPPSIGFSLGTQPFSLQTLPDSKSLDLALDGSGAKFTNLQLRSLDGKQTISLNGSMSCK